MNDIEKQTYVNRKLKHWPTMFWVLMRVLALFYHRSVVTERKCFSCHVRQISNQCYGKRSNLMDAHLDFYVSAYESNPSSETNDENKNVQYQDGDHCETCLALWWNCYREPFKYTDRDIGVSPLGRRWNGIISNGWFVVALAILTYEFCSVFLRLYGKSEEILNFLLTLTLYQLLMVHYAFTMCSKIHSIFKASVPRLYWSTTLNVRYLIKRAQMLDLPNRGLPGLPFLVLCASCPLLLSGYRVMIFLYISNCDITVHSVVRSVIGVIFMVNWGLSVYIIYFIRVSFQHQFKLLLAYMKEFEDDIRRCKSILLDVVADFACYYQFCSLYMAVCFPAVVIAVVGNISTAYINDQSTCVGDDLKSQEIVQHLSVLAWSEIAMALILLAVAMGGYKVRYIWENFVTNVMILKCNESQLVGKKLFFEANYLLRESNLILATIVFSVTGIYMGFQYGEQNGAFLNSSCNGTSSYASCT